ncbi:DUF721 domain-containing protein [Magnetococcales bacterium HHB-1]
MNEEKNRPEQYSNKIQQSIPLSPDEPKKNKEPYAHLGKLSRDMFWGILKKRYPSTHYLWRNWSRIMGIGLALHCEPHRIIAGILYIRVDSSSWSSNLHFLKPKLLKKINEHLPAKHEHVKEIILETGRLKRQMRKPVQKDSRPQLHKGHLPPPLDTEIKTATEWTKNLIDPDYKETIYRAVLSGLVFCRFQEEKKKQKEK